jgi:hypothetical protein
MPGVVVVVSNPRHDVGVHGAGVSALLELGGR